MRITVARYIYYRATNPGTLAFAQIIYSPVISTYKIRCIIDKVQRNVMLATKSGILYHVNNRHMPCANISHYMSH